jgi:C4-dicarboxylate-specific signal transduction histidine kinase
LAVAGDLSPQDVQEILDDIVRDDKRAGEIIRRMRALLERNDSVHETVDILRCIKDTAGLLRGKLLEAGVSLTLDVASGLPCVEAGPIEVQQVILNLMLNGIESMAMSGTELSDRRLTVTARHEAKHVVVCVRDRGPGVPAERMENVFQPFNSSKPEGLGLGLAICRRIAESHGGKLWLEANTKGGASFCFSLPVAAEKS